MISQCDAHIFEITFRSTRNALDIFIEQVGMEVGGVWPACHHCIFWDSGLVQSCFWLKYIIHFKLMICVISIFCDFLHQHFQTIYAKTCKGCRGSSSRPLRSLYLQWCEINDPTGRITNKLKSIIILKRYKLSGPEGVYYHHKLCVEFGFWGVMLYKRVDKSWKQEEIRKW